MDICIKPRKLGGSICAITSKSDAHRIILCSALCRENVKIYINSISEDIYATIDCINALGCKTEIFDDHIIVHPVNIGSKNDIYTLNCRESGSTLRFMLSIVAALGLNCVFEGNGRLPQRPLSPLYELLTDNGVTYTRFGSILPLQSTGKLKPGTFTFSGNVSSQFTTGLLMALPLLTGDSKIILTPPVESRPYIDMTLNTLRLFGISITETNENNNSVFYIKGNQVYISPKEIQTEGDWSNIAFWFIAGALSNRISIKGLNPYSAQGDKYIAEYVKNTGRHIYQDNGIYTIENTKSINNAIDTDASSIPDLVPIIAVNASVANGTTHIYNAGRLRIKESDRLYAVSENLKKLGADVKELSDGLVITGKDSLNGGTTDSYNDHRIAMAMAVASTVCKDNVVIKNAEAVNKSYPTFFDDFKKLGGETNVIGLR